MAQPLLHPMGEESLRPHPAPVARAAADTPPRWRKALRMDEKEEVYPVDGEALLPPASRRMGEEDTFPCPEALRAANDEEQAPLFAEDEVPLYPAYDEALPFEDAEFPRPAEDRPAPPVAPKDDSRDAVPTSQMPLPVCVPLDVDPFAPRRRVWPWALGAALCALAVLGWRIFGTLK